MIQEQDQKELKNDKLSNFYYIGEIDYQKCLDLQLHLNSKRSQSDRDTVLFLTHPDTISLGLRGENSDILIDEKFIKENQITISKTNRGGQTTLHGIGQLVIYYIVDIRQFNNQIKKFVEDLKNIAIITFKTYGVDVIPLYDELEGIWYQEETQKQIQEKKICSIGISVKNKVLMHGMSINLNIDTNKFNWIVACGQKDKKQIALKEILKHDVDIFDFASRYKDIYCQILGYKNDKLIEKEPSSLISDV